VHNWKIFGTVQFPEAIVNHRIRIVSFDPAMTHETTDTKSIEAKAICLFYGVTFALGLSICLPLWVSCQGLRLPTARILLMVMMFAPAAGVLIVRLFLPKSVIPLVQTTGLGIGRWPRTLGYWLFGWFGLTVIGLATPFIAALLGQFRLDLENFSGYNQLLQQRPDGAAALARFPVQTLVLFQLGSLLIAPGLNAIFVFGEEWGWRGFLLPKLLPLGQWRALLLTGTLWGLWYSPVVLLGYDYPFHPKIGVILMTIFCIIFGVLLGWLRLATGSIWPAAIGHGALNAVGAFPYVVADANQTIDTAHVTILGWTGWILPLCFIFLLVVLKRLPVVDPRC
jgi:membrane protease YdiL (CAAX protease family)